VRSNARKDAWFDKRKKQSVESIEEPNRKRHYICFIIDYNFTRLHQALSGLTPAEMANANLNSDENEWLSLIQQSVLDQQIPKATVKKLCQIPIGNQNRLAC